MQFAKLSALLLLSALLRLAQCVNIFVVCDITHRQDSPFKGTSVDDIMSIGLLLAALESGRTNLNVVGLTYQSSPNTLPDTPLDPILQRIAGGQLFPMYQAALRGHEVSERRCSRELADPTSSVSRMMQTIRQLGSP